MDAYARSKTPKEERDRRATPQWVVEAIQHVLNIRFDVDVCADSRNFKAPLYLDVAKIDALTCAWNVRRDLLTGRVGVHPGVFAFMNPPYSDPGPWCEKAATEARERSMFVVGLLPDDRSTHWYQQWIDGVACVCYVPDIRISFLGPDGKPQAGNPKGSIFPIWTPWEVENTQSVYFTLSTYKPEGNRV